MDSTDEYDTFFTPLPSDFDFELLDNRASATSTTNGQQRPLSTSTPTVAARQPKKIKADEELLELVQSMAAKTQIHARTYQNLDGKQKAAASDPERKEKYSSSETRATMRTEARQRCDGKTPRWYQEDAAEAFLLGMDVLLISATSSGKTLAFLQALLADKTAKSPVIIISPLNELECDMADRCNKMGLPALAVNGDMWAKDPLLHKKLLNHEFRVILTSPEMIFKHDKFSEMMRDAKWTANIIGTVIDEAHCVLEWKESFRTSFGLLGKARTYLSGKPMTLFSMWATKSTIAKRKIMRHFRDGRINILFATEVAGMVRVFVNSYVRDEIVEWVVGGCLVKSYLH